MVLLPRVQHCTSARAQQSACPGSWERESYSAAHRPEGRMPSCPRCYRPMQDTGELGCWGAGAAHHLVGQDAVDAVVVQVDEPVEALHLVLAHDAVLDAAGLRGQPVRAVRAVPHQVSVLLLLSVLAAVPALLPAPPSVTPCAQPGGGPTRCTSGGWHAWSAPGLRPPCTLPMPALGPLHIAHDTSSPPLGCLCAAAGALPASVSAACWSGLAWQHAHQKPLGLHAAELLDGTCLSDMRRHPP